MPDHMRSQVLTLKYRPQAFSELLVQDHVKSTLVRAIELGRLANAYLFSGPRGVGKTTTARILAKCLNCARSDKPTSAPCGACGACVEIAGSRSLDVLEIDGASNRGIDQIRELRENIRYTPSSSRFKVYIIDEVHMLTDAAFNALLKTLEEPPKHARFVFATTEVHRVPTTILSRCQRFDFRRATVDETVDRLRWLACKESIPASEDALYAIARRSGGAIRDAESTLEQLATFRPEAIELQAVEELLGSVPTEMLFDVIDLAVAGDSAGLVRLLERLFLRGHDLLEFHGGLVGHLRNLLLLLVGGSDTGLGLLPAEKSRLEGQLRDLDRARLTRGIELLMRTEESLRTTRLPHLTVEYAVLELARQIGPAVHGGSERPNRTCDRQHAQRNKGSADTHARRRQAGDPTMQRITRVFGEAAEDTCT